MPLSETRKALTGIFSPRRSVVREVGHEGSEVAIVHADQVGAKRYGSLQLSTSWVSTSASMPRRRASASSSRGERVIDHGHDHQNRVRAQSARFDHLPWDRRGTPCGSPAVRRRIAARGDEIARSAPWKLGPSVSTERHAAPPRHRPSRGRRDRNPRGSAPSRRGFLDFGDERRPAGRGRRLQRGSKTPRRRASVALVRVHPVKTRELTLRNFEALVAAISARMSRLIRAVISIRPVERSFGGAVVDRARQPAPRPRAGSPPDPPPARRRRC